MPSRSEDICRPIVIAATTVDGFSSPAASGGGPVTCFTFPADENARLHHMFSTVILFIVSVPVLSVQITVAALQYVRVQYS